MGCMNISPYRGICGFFLSVFKWIPVFVISGIVAWSYYAYVVHLCILTIESDVEKVLLLIPYHVLATLFLASYWRTVWTRPGDIPKRFRLTADELDNVEGSENDETQKRLLEQIVIDKDLPVAMRTIQGAVRYCEKCATVKPDRAHHCSVCGTCVLKMDHHCPWVNNCVAFNNYKFFVLFLLYGLVYCLFVALSSLKYFIRFWTRSMDGQVGHGKFHILFLFFVSAMFCISLCSLLGYHIHLVLNNRTTLEAFRAPVFRRGPDKEGFSLGKRGNIAEVFGDDWWRLPLPVFSSFGDGLTYPQRFAEDTEMGYGGGSTTGNGTTSGRRNRGYSRGQQETQGEDERVPMLSADMEDEEEDVEEMAITRSGWDNIKHSESDLSDSEEELLVGSTNITVQPTVVLESPGAKDFVNVTIES